MQRRNGRRRSRRPNASGTRRAATTATSAATPEAASRRATTSGAPCCRIAAGRRRRKLRLGRVTARLRKRGHGKRRVPSDNPTLDLFEEDLFPEGMKYQASFLSPEEEQALLR